MRFSDLEPGDVFHFQYIRKDLIARPDQNYVKISKYEYRIVSKSNDDVIHICHEPVMT